MTIVFDAQVNVGQNVFGPTSSLEEYHHECPKNHQIMLMIPTATHRYQLNEHLVEESCIWEYQTSVRFYKKIYYDDKLIQVIYNPKNPYQHINQFVLTLIRQFNKSTSRQHYFCPKFHPHLDTQSEIEALISQNETLAVKINGIASFSGPEDVPKWFINILKMNDLPLFVHTHYFNPYEIPNTINPWLYYIGLNNHPLRWIQFGLKHELKIFLAHGLHCCPISTALVNKHDNFLVGLGPISLLNKESEYNHPRVKNYLQTCLSKIGNSKLAYSSDYAWNVKKRNEWSTREWNDQKYIEDSLIALNARNSFTKVMYENAWNFFVKNKT